MSSPKRRRTPPIVVRKTLWHSLGDYSTTPALASVDLGAALRNGHLAIFLGAGISIPMGIPGWGDLLNGCISDPRAAPAKLKTFTKKEIAKKSGDDLARIAEVLSSRVGNEAFLEIVRDQLYPSGSITELIPTPMLYALSALLSGADRGRISNVLTLNFDDNIEQHLRLHGQLFQVVESLPQLLGNSGTLVFHPHGYLPRVPSDPKSSKKIVFDKLSFDKLLGDESNPWKRFIRELIRTNIIIVVGMGINDPHLQALFSALEEEIRGLGRPSAFWCVSSESKEYETTKNSLALRNIAALGFKDLKKDIPEFLLSICRSAAATVKKGPA